MAFVAGCADRGQILYLLILMKTSCERIDKVFRKKKISEPQNQITGLVGVDTQIHGDINFQGGLRIDGRVIGNVTALGDKPSTLVMSEGGFVQGAIQVSHAIINGTVIGPIHSDEYLELQAQAKVSGVVSYKNMETQMGATVNGMCHHLDNPKPGSNVVTLIPPSEGDSPSLLRFTLELDDQ